MLVVDLILLINLNKNLVKCDFFLLSFADFAKILIHCFVFW